MEDTRHLPCQCLQFKNTLVDGKADSIGQDSGGTRKYHIRSQDVGIQRTEWCGKLGFFGVRSGYCEVKSVSEKRRQMGQWKSEDIYDITLSVWIVAEAWFGGGAL